ncbi:Uncharacterized protein TCM_046172 [Theobroma cacao]|uniref:Uncharacterized protein n=1 Tax=Theobroma cacao TaxID=3641 RepID=S1RU68_THECC|nr:Uncharacterized protein TCM_046172 [Theobroma cacao]
MRKEHQNGALAGFGGLLKTRPRCFLHSLVSLVYLSPSKLRPFSLWLFFGLGFDRVYCGCCMLLGPFIFLEKI